MIKTEDDMQGQNVDQRTSVDTTTSGHSDGNTPRQVKKRNRIPVSCNECRRRKLRCDRNDPCSACVQRGDAEQCKFSEPLTQPKPRSAAKPGSREFLQQRIHRLELLVTDLAAQVRHSTSPPSQTDSSQSPEQRTLDQSDVSSHTSPSHTGPEVDSTEPSDKPIDDLRIAMGDMKFSNGKVLYTGGNSWNTILDEIAEIKSAMNPIYSSYHQHAATQGGLTPHRPSSFPFFAAPPPSISDLLALVPSRSDTEALVNKFFRTVWAMCPCIHRPTFLTNLKTFYEAPESADPIFLGTLFAMLASGISIFVEDNEHTRNILLQKGVSERKDLALIWQDASLQSFCLGNFLANTTLDNLQGLVVLHTYFTAFQASLSFGWPLYGMIVSIALNMGLHRDGEQFGLDVYETEMRRRIWAVLIMLDGLSAASYGRPMMISDTQFDTKPLASLNDADLHPGLKTLPRQPANTITDTTYAQAKFTLTKIIRKIISSLFGIKPPSYDTILKLDGQIREVYNTIPESLKFEEIQRLVPLHPPPTVAVAVQRLGLNVIANHALVILHRPFLYRSFSDSRYTPSREKCVEAAHQVLQLFHEYRDSPQYLEFSWYAIGGLHAFHAATVVALRCYLEPLTCSQEDWMAVERARAEFEKIAHGPSPSWAMLGEKGSKVFSILIRKALEKKAILENTSGQKGVSIGPSSTFPSNTAAASTFSGFSTTANLNFTPSLDGGSSSTGLTPQYSEQPLFGATNQFDMNPLTNPGLQADAYRGSAMLLGVGMPGVATTDSWPEQQPNWDMFWPKGTNLTEWDIFFDNMDIDLTSLGTNSSSITQAGIAFDQLNAFPNPGPAPGSSNRPLEWDFVNSSFGGNML